MTPECPCCHAKFSHDREKQGCKMCGLPDEVRDRGEEAIAAWHEQTLVNKKLFGRHHARVAHRDAPTSKRERKRMLHHHPARRARNKPGRSGVKRAA